MAETKQQMLGTYPPLTHVINGSGEVMAIALLFSDDKTLKGVGIGVYTYYKLLGLLGLVNVNLHNQLSESGYTFYF